MQTLKHGQYEPVNGLTNNRDNMHWEFSLTYNLLNKPVYLTAWIRTGQTRFLYHFRTVI